MNVSSDLLFYFERINWFGKIEYLYKNGRSDGNLFRVKYFKRIKRRELRLIFRCQDVVTKI